MAGSSVLHRVVMAVTLSSIPTIGEIYNAGVLKSAQTIRHSPSASLLQKISLYQGDICNLELDAIVNAANRTLLGGGGVDGAIHAAAGRQLLQECRTLNGCETGQSKITRGYNLPARHVVHAVGPVYSFSDVKTISEQLASCYRTSLQLAAEHSLKHIAFPAISTGIYGYPIEDATHIALGEIRRFCDSENSNKVDRPTLSL